MTFYPDKGNYSMEDFDSSVGAVFDSPNLQGIVGGYVTLKSLNTGSLSYINTWNTNITWTRDDPLYSATTIADTFDILTGDLPALTNTVTGSYGISPNTSAWFIETPYPSFITGYGYSGRGDFVLTLEEGGADPILSDSYDAGSEATTFEFDVSSETLYSGQLPLPGFSATGTNLSGLPPLTGVINHGLLFCDGTRWDYIEITPDGVRSFNHPELAIPINLYSPKKIRVGFRGFDMFIATEDGRSVAGYNKFDTEVTTPPVPAFAAFGAPSFEASYATGEGILEGAIATVGRSTWDNIRLITGQMAIFELSGAEQLYTTGYSTMYSAPFDPGVNLNSYLYANITSVPFRGGETIVEAQSSGLAGWETHSSVTVSTGSSDSLDLSSFPVVSYPRAEGGTDYLSNPIRFKIDQRSYNGDSLPPAVEGIEVFASKANLNIDMLPDWKQVNSLIKSKVYIQTGTFLTDDPTPQLWTSLLMNTPEGTGQYADTDFFDESSSIPISVVGTGETTLRGPFGSSFKNFVDVSRSGVAGSAAFQAFGGQPVFNFFPNPLFSDPFRTLSSGEPNYYTGISEGEIAGGMLLATTYTGSHNIQLSKQAVYRPETQARVSKINSYLGRTSSPNEEYAQSVYVFNNGNTHDGTVGIDAVIPSGIATGNLKVTFDLQVLQGTGIDVTMVGSSNSTFSLPGDYFREYRTVGFPIVNEDNYEFLVRFNVPAGHPAEDYEFNIDNLTVSACSSSYLEATGLSGYLHQSGVAHTEVFAQQTPRKAATVFSSSIYLYSYPQAQGTLLNLTGDNGRGLDISIDSSGYITADIDTISNSWSPNNTTAPLFEERAQETITSHVPLPLGRWTSVGFLHNADSYSGWTHVTSSGDGSSWNFAATNKSYLTIDGHPTASLDMMSGWRVPVDYRDRAYPYVTYVDLTGDVRATFASGLQCEIDAVHIQRPPSADVETDLTLKGARAYVPYMVPDSLYLPNNIADNHIITGAIPEDRFIGSCYNFSSPSYTEWDRSYLKNHLIYHGLVDKDLLSPYSGQELYSTRFHSGAYGRAPYSSSYEKLQNNTGQQFIPDTESNMARGDIRAAGWLYPRTTGAFLTLYEDSSNLTGSRLELAVSPDLYITVNKYDSTTNSIVVTDTGQPVSLSGWTFVNLHYDMDEGYLDFGDTSPVTVWLANESGLVNSPAIITGVDYGLNYRNDFQSEFHFGGGADCNLFNWILPIPSTGETDIVRNLHGDHAKSGRFQTVVVGNVAFTGRQDYPTYGFGYLHLGVGNTGEDYYFGLAMHNSYDTQPKFGGIVAYDDKPFREVNNYNLSYDTTSITQAFGSTTSPIRLGNQVPDEAINIARVSSPTYSVSSSIANIDLSDSNINNLISYRNGKYDIGGSDIIEPSSVTGYHGINIPLYSGRFDLTLSGQVLSSDVEISTIPIADQETNTYDKAYYYYLIGRGDRAVRALGTFPHYTGQIYETSTGQVVDNYTANLQRIKKSIKLKNAKGEEISKQTYPYDIAISPYTPDDLYFSALSGEDISLDNIGGYTSGRVLPDSIYTVILLTSRNKVPGQSVFVHYDSYDIYSQQEQASFKEIVNPQPIFREKHETETPTIGHFSLDLNESNYYDLKFYGLATGYSGQL
tara:strand:+ start:114862 stop:119724 length:4863 start_codon:yes stop_codon:yes gene_type:complete